MPCRARPVSEFRDPPAFAEQLFAIMQGVATLMELAPEPPAPDVSPGPFDSILSELPPPTFDLAKRFARPHEFLQCVLDMVRVNFEPNPPGTLFLNSNLDFLLQGIPSEPFRLGHVSLTGEADDDSPAFWRGQVVPKLQRCGYAVGAASALYAVVSTAPDKLSMRLIVDVLETLDAGFTADEALGLMAGHLPAAEDALRVDSYAGFCYDEALGDRLRLSLWLFMDAEPLKAQ